MPVKKNQVLHAYDESLLQANTDNLSLSIQLAPDGFSFSIFRPDDHKYLSVESIHFNQDLIQQGSTHLLLEALNNNKWLNRAYDSVQIFYEIPLVSLVPSSLFNPADQESISGFSFAVPEGHHLNNERLQNLDAHLLFYVPDRLEETLMQKFPAAVFQSHARSLVDLLMLINKNLPQQKRMFVNVRNAHLDLLIIEGKQLLFYNIFHYTSKEDFIYYILFVMDQLNLSPEELSLHLSGLVDKNSTLFDMAFKYVKNISFVEAQQPFIFSHVFDDVPLHYYFNLFKSPLCEL